MIKYSYSIFGVFTYFQFFLKKFLSYNKWILKKLLHLRPNGLALFDNPRELSLFVIYEDWYLYDSRSVGWMLKRDKEQI